LRPTQHKMWIWTRRCYGELYPVGELLI
jgi:hypothetical protein